MNSKRFLNLLFANECPVAVAYRTSLIPAVAPRIRDVLCRNAVLFGIL